MAKKQFHGTFQSLLLGLLLFVPTSFASAQWNEQVLHSFQSGTDGDTPTGRIVFDQEGNLYGATTGGGSQNCSPVASCGTVFQLTPPAKDGDPWIETVLYVFKGAKYGDGDLPAGGLLIDSKGNLYGTTAYGGTGNCVLLGISGGCGTVYELSPPAPEGGAWTETVLYSFPTAVQGYAPQGDLVFDREGNLYGATVFGGGYGTTCDPYYQYCGAIFELSPPRQKGGAWTEAVLHGFKGVPGGSKEGASIGDGAAPNGGLVLDSSGNIYGTTQLGGFGGLGQGGGMVFELSPPKAPDSAWTEKVLYRFRVKDGGNPAAGMVLDSNGNLYGTTYFGPPNSFGTVFELQKPRNEAEPWAETALVLFDGFTNGGYPDGGLAFDRLGDLYGTALEIASGEVFRLKAPSSVSGPRAVEVLYEFVGSSGGHPDAPLVFDKEGNIYSTTQWGGTGQGCGFAACGVVFEVSP